MGAPTLIRAVRAHRLPAQEPGLAAGLAPELQAVANAPAGPSWAEHRTRFVLELVGDEVSGWHGPVSEPVLALIRDGHAAGVIGHDAAHHRRLAYRPVLGRHHRGPHAQQAASAIELACWDLASQVSGLPVADLLGGTIRSRVPVYASALGLDPEHPEGPAAAKWIYTNGFWGQKWPLTRSLIAAGPAAVYACLSGLRQAAPENRFMVDAHGRCRADDVARLLPVLADLDVSWVEELSIPGAGNQPSTVPLAAGEHAVDPVEQIGTLISGTVQVWQIDPGWTGLGRALHTVDMAAELGIPTFPHASHLPTAMQLAGACCRDKVPAVEYHLTVEPLRQQIFTTPTEPDDGWLPTRNGPGLTSGYRALMEAPLLLAEEGQ